MKAAKLDALARSLTGPFAFCGIAVAQGNEQHIAIAQQPFLKADADTQFRVASISKVVVGRCVAALVESGVAKWGTDVTDILGWSFRHPVFPDIPVTLGMVAAHHAGLDDKAGYLIPCTSTLQDWCMSRNVFAREPGTYFQYSNLGYIVLADVIERLSGKTFPSAITSYLPQTASFNWVGADPQITASALPIYRAGADGFIAQVDQQANPAPAGNHVGVYSPQGGLRTSMAGLLDLARGLRDVDPAPLWTPRSGAGDYLDGVFESYGAGLQIYETPRFYPRPLIGHFGNAYGFNGGVWYDRTRDLAFAYGLNGLPLGDESDEFSAAERQIFVTISDLT